MNAAQPDTDGLAIAAIETDRLVEVAARMFDALASGDRASFFETVTPDFFAFDIGERMDGTTLFNAVAAARSRGKRYVWTIQRPVAGLGGGLAWLAYENEGWIEDAAGRTDKRWLESLSLVHDDGRWRVRFLHSTATTPVGGSPSRG